MKTQVLAVYDLWQAGGHKPYDYLFRLPSNHLEVDHAVLRVGNQRDNEDLENLDKD